MRLDPTFYDHLREEDLDLLLGIGRRQSLMIDQLQSALEAGDEQAALAVARELVNLEKTIKLS
jgi:hypothetical protein